MFLIKSIILLGLFVFGFKATRPDLSKYTNQQALAADYSIYWNVENEVIYLVIVANTTGWVGFGVGEQNSGSMPGSDFVTGWVENNSAKIQDRYSFEYDLPKEDECQDWTLHGFDESGDATFLEISRKIHTGDHQDRPFPAGPTRILFAWGSQDRVSFHGTNRGLAVVTFYNTTDDVNRTADDVTEVAEFRLSNAVIPPVKTTYMCQSFEMPTVEDGQIIQIDPIINVYSQSQNFVHHMLAHICYLDESNWNIYPTPTDCMSDGTMDCDPIFYGWAGGVGSWYAPNDVGIRIGNSTRHGIKYIVLQVHYDNPQLLSGISDDSGIRIHYTSNIRTYDAGMFILGDMSTSFPDIPPKSITEYESSCPSECTQEFPHDITVIGDTLHMHQSGKRMWSTHWRNDTHIGDFNRVDFFDFDLQQNTIMHNSVIKRGDRINTHCVYDTSSRTNYTRFGPGSEEEMCMEFIIYYPIMLDDNGEPYNYCGWIRYSGKNLTLCGSGADSSSLKNIPNPSIPDPPHTGAVIFGSLSDICKENDERDIPIWEKIPRVAMIAGGVFVLLSITAAITYAVIKHRNAKKYLKI